MTIEAREIPGVKSNSEPSVVTHLGEPGYASVRVPLRIIVQRHPRRTCPTCRRRRVVLSFRFEPDTLGHRLMTLELGSQTEMRCASCWGIHG